MTVALRRTQQPTAAGPLSSVRRLVRATHLTAIGLLLAAALPAFADGARFDLTGPKIEVRVTRSGVTLPIASVPNLQPGDRLWLHPALPASQSVRYLLVLAFLRGTTNPPPDSWFLRIETWDKKVQEEGVEVTVPDEAQQAVLFLAPVTGGDFTTLRSAVQGRPGVFVRASQDLAQAGFEQARIEKYLASMREVPAAEDSDPKSLQEHSNLIAGTLALKPNGDCMKLQPDQQYTCLTQSGNQTLLDDGHGQTIVDALTGGAGAGLINTASATQLAGGGVYSAYIGSIVDLVHIMGSLHTAQYQYIPAIAFPQQQSLNLRLNTPPSFHNPKSVIVIGLPSIQSTVPPPLRAADPHAVSCLAKPGLVLPVEGAPLVFSTSFAHDLVLHINYPGGTRPEAAEPQDIPLTADAYKGGLVLATIPKRHPLSVVQVSLPTTGGIGQPKLATPAAPPADPAEGLTGTIRGGWGFDTFTGPTMMLEDAPGKDWKVAGEDQLIAGPGAPKDQHVLLTSTGTACIQSISLEVPQAKPEKTTWKPAVLAADAVRPNAIDVSLNLTALPGRDPATLHLAVHQFGDAKTDTVSLVSYARPATLGGLELHSGDRTATLTGTSLDEVREMKLGGTIFAPVPSGAASTPTTIRLAQAADAAPPALHAGDKLTAQVLLKDGRSLPLAFTVAPARPSVTLLNKAIVAPETAPKAALAIQLASPDDLPISDTLLFSLRSAQPFPRAGKIEIAAADSNDAPHATLTVAGETLVLEDPTTLLARFDPLKAFGPSAFGPIRMRAVGPDGSAGDWLPLAILVRLPTLTGLSCPVAPPTPVAKHAKQPTPAATAKPASPDTAPASETSAPSEPAAQDAANHTASAPASADAKPASGPPTSDAASAPETAQPVPPSAPTTAPAAAAAPPKPCTLTGSSLYLLDSIAPAETFADPTRVPPGYVGSSLTVPPPTGAVYYLRLRDDPDPIDTVTLPAGPL